MAAGKPQSRITGPNDTVMFVIVCVLLAGLALAVYGPTWAYGFVDYDDGDYFYSNPQVKAGLTWSGIVWAFQAGYASNWHPLVWISLMLDAQLFGPGAMGPHITNTLLHAANTVLLFLALKRLTGLRSPQGKANQPGVLWPSAFVAAVFAVHPLHVESVAWISERKDVLSGLFFMLTLLMYARYVERKDALQSGRGMAYGLTLLLFALGLMSKPMLVTLPFVLLLLDWWPLMRLNRQTVMRLVGEKIPFVLLSAASCVVTLYAQKQAFIPITSLPLGQRLENAATVCVAYLGQMFYPSKLAIMYPFADVVSAGWLAALALLAIITVLALVWRERRPYLLVGWLWNLGMLVPVLGIVQVGFQALADRYTYLPQIGLYFALAWLARDLSATRPQLRVLFAGTALAVIIALTAAALVQVTYWRNNLALWQHTVACTGFNPIALVNLDVALGDALPPEKGMEDFQRILAAMPDYSPGHYDLGTLLYRQKRYDEAAAEFQKACDLSPRYAEAYNNLANVRLAQGRLDEAAALYRKTIELKPDYEAPRLYLAMILMRQGRLEDAAEQYRAALVYSPEDTAASVGLANILFAQGRLDEAVAQYQKVIARKPDDAEAQYNLGLALGRLGRLAEAETQFRKTIELNPGYADAHGNLAKLLTAEGKLTEALAEYQRTLKLVPNSAQAHLRYGEALRANRDYVNAAAEFQLALQIDPQRMEAYLDLAWLRATSRDASLRNGAEAVQLAQRAQQLAGGGSPQILDTLAAAQAEAGRFGEAVQTAKAALGMCTNDEALAVAIQRRINLYESSQAYREAQ